MRTITWMFTALSLIVMIFIAGCATTSSSAPVSTTVPVTDIRTPHQTSIPATTMPSTITTVTPEPADTVTEKEILRDTGILTTKTYKMYDFKDLGYKFVYPYDTFRITIKSEKPVLGYALSTERAGQLQGSQLIPRYETYLKGGIDWGLIEPVMVIERATDTTKEFTLQDVGPLTYVVDGRWMSYDSNYDNTPPFTYEITIVKTGGPTKQSFDFAGYDTSAVVTSKTRETG